MSDSASINEEKNSVSPSCCYYFLCYQRSTIEIEILFLSPFTGSAAILNFKCSRSSVFITTKEVWLAGWTPCFNSHVKLKGNSWWRCQKWFHHIFYLSNTFIIIAHSRAMKIESFPPEQAPDFSSFLDF